MTGQNAVLDAAALERKAHVPATVIEREDAPAVVHDEDRAMATVHNEPALRLQLLSVPQARILCWVRPCSSGPAAGVLIHRHSVAEKRKAEVVQELHQTMHFRIEGRAI
jgi:hypothetical protein